MTKTHWLASPNKNYLGHQDLPNGDDIVVTIKSAGMEDVTDPTKNKTEPKRVVRFEEDGVKPWICNQTNAAMIVKLSGVKFMEDSAGVRLQLYVETIRDKRTKEDVDCIRIRPAIPPARETMNPQHPKWSKVCDRVKAGETTLDGIRKHFDISEADFELAKK